MQDPALGQPRDTLEQKTQDSEDNHQTVEAGVVTRSLGLVDVLAEARAAAQESGHHGNHQGSGRCHAHRCSDVGHGTGQHHPGQDFTLSHAIGAGGVACHWVGALHAIHSLHDNGEQAPRGTETSLQ